MCRPWHTTFVLSPAGTIVYTGIDPARSQITAAVARAAHQRPR